jgi:Zn-dependent protease with chaperone function
MRTLLSTYVRLYSIRSFAPKHGSATDLFMSAILAAFIAVLPAAFALWSSRQILALSDNATVPERLLANRARNGLVTALCGGVLGAIAFRHLPWALALLVLTRLGASYSFRKQLHRESWGFGAYFSFFSRLTLAVFGFWLLLALTPWFVWQADPYEWAVAGVFAAVLLAWNEGYGIVFRTLLHARPVDDPEIVACFDEMRARCSILPVVRLEQVDLRGGSFINAVALPSIRRPAVLVSSPLLDRMDRDETVAIIAHELAHLEYFNARRLWRLNLQGYALVAVGTLLAPVVGIVAPHARTAVFALWPALLLASMAIRARHRQAHETASDLRAIVLAGGADPLIRALTKLHALARVPRRWDSERERHASHPSLARRIQAIRDASQMAPAALGEAATFRAGDDSSSVTFSDERLVWREGRNTEHAIDYRRLTTLRVDARRSGAAYLVAIDVEHRRWEMLLRSEDVARMQVTLDIVDTRLAASAPPPTVMRPLPRVLALMALTLAAPIGQLAVVLIGALAAAWPSQPVIAATSLASLGGFLLAWRSHGLWLNDGLHWTALPLLVCGIALAAVAVANRREQLPPHASRFAGLLAALILVTCGAAAIISGDSLDLHHAARAWSWVSILVLAHAGAMALERRGWLREASVALALAGLVFIYLGSMSFLERFVKDPFVARAPTVVVTTVSPTPVAEVSLPFEVSSLHLSPAGRYIAVGTENDKEQTTIHAGRVGDSLTAFTADDAAFADERRLLLLERLSGTSSLRLVDLARASDDVWTLSVPVQRARLSFDRASQRWSLLGWNASGNIATATGVVGQDTVGNLGWKAPDAHVALISGSSSEILGLEWKTIPGRFGAGHHAAFVLWSITDRGSSVWTTTRLELGCGPLSTRGEAALCLAFDGTRTRFFEVNPVTRRLKPLVSVDGRFFRRGEENARGWIAGWSSVGSVLLRPDDGTAIRVDGRGGSRADELAIADSVIGAVFSNENGSTVRLYDRGKIGVPR